MPNIGEWERTVAKKYNLHESWLTPTTYGTDCSCCGKIRRNEHYIMDRGLLCVFCASACKKLKRCSKNEFEPTGLIRIRNIAIALMAPIMVLGVLLWAAYGLNEVSITVVGPDMQPIEEKMIIEFEAKDGSVTHTLTSDSGETTISIGWIERDTYTVTVENENNEVLYEDTITISKRFEEVIIQLKNDLEKEEVQ